MRFVKNANPLACSLQTLLFFFLPFPTHSHSSRCVIGPVWNAYRFSTMHRLPACVTRTVGGSAFPGTPTCGRRRRRRLTASGCHGGKKKNETKPKKRKEKFSRCRFHFWRQRYVFGLLIAGDCNHSAAQQGGGEDVNACRDLN